MKRLKYLLLASLVAFAACDEETPTDTVIQLGSVTVTVTAGGAGVQGATVSLGAAGTTPQTTSAQGVASFTNVPAGTYVVTVTGLTSDVICSSTTQPVTVAGGATTGVTFACNVVQTSSISGTVAFANGDPRPGATVTITRTAPAPAAAAVNVTTDAQGRYMLTGLRSGTYTVSLPVTTGCTTAAITRTGIAVAAGESRVENFQCTVTPPPPAQEPATVAIRSITTGGLGLTPVPDNAVLGIVQVTLNVNEGDQRVTKVELLLGDRVVCTHDRTVAAPEADMQLADFDVVCVVNTAEFNPNTGVPNWLNGASQFRARIYTVASGSTVAAATGTRAIVLVNVDASYTRVVPQRTALSTNSSASGTGLLWWNGNLTVTALPVMYSGLAIQNVTINVTGFVPASTTNLATYFGGGGGNVTVSRLLTAAPFTTTLSGTDDINDSGNPFSNNNGVNLVEDAAILVTVVVLRADGQPGPGLASATVCSDGALPNPAVFPPPGTGCANGQPANFMRLDNFAPVIGFIDQALRWSASFADPSRAASAQAVALGFVNTGVTGWVHEGFTFTASRVLAGDASVCSATAACPSNPTAPRVADLGVGTPTTGFFSYNAGTAPTAVSAITTAGQLTETFDNNVYYLQIVANDVFGTMGATQNRRTRFYNGNFEGTGTSGGNISTLLTMANARFGVDEGDPCFTSNGTVCTGALLNGTRLDTDGDVIGVAGTVTLGNGGVMNGTSFVAQLLDLGGPEGGTPSFFPNGPVIARVRQRAPTIGTTAGCYVGLIASNACQFTGASGARSGMSGSYDFYTPLDAGAFYRTFNPITGAVTNRNTDAAGTTLDFDGRTMTESTGYWQVELRLTDNAGNESPTTERLFVWDRMAPVLGGLSFAASVAAAAPATFTTVATDDLDLDRAEFYYVWNQLGAQFAILQNRTTLGEFGFAAYTTSASATSTSMFVHSVRVGAAGPAYPTMGSLFRVFDFGRNAAEANGGVPAVSTTPLPAEPNDITAASLFSSTALLCWDTDSNGCPTNPTSATLTFQVTGPTQVPFNRVDFLIGIDVNDDGAVDTDVAGNTLWAQIAQGAAVSVIGNVSTFTRTFTVQEIVNAARRSFIPFALDPTYPVANQVHIRAIGYRPNGTAFTVAQGFVACPNAAGTGTGCQIQLERN